VLEADFFSFVWLPVEVVLNPESGNSLPNPVPLLTAMIEESAADDVPVAAIEDGCALEARLVAWAIAVWRSFGLERNGARLSTEVDPELESLAALIGTAGADEGAGVEVGAEVEAPV